MLLVSKTYSQSTYRFGAIPSINLNTDLKKGWDVNFKSEFRHGFRKGTKGLEPDLVNEYLQTDASFLTAKKVGLGNKLAFGFLLRFREDRIIQRYIQQFILVRNFDSYRMSFRFATDETFDDSTEIRLRYRTSAEFPLNGRKVDSQEFYLKLNHEFLNNFENGNYDIETRIIPLLGYKFKDNNKLEFGLDYRLDSFLDEKPRHTAWVSINWYVKI